jgi:nitrogen fixation protein NifB
VEDIMHKPKNAHAEIIRTHPCFNENAHSTFGRVHLPVAPACNIQCRYCIRKYDCANESRPGITSTVLAPWEALDRVGALIERNDRISVVGIAGPGDPLANETTFDALKSINRQFPGLTLCLSTNGLALSDRLEDLVKSGVKSLTVTINAVTPETAEKVYAWILYRGKRYSGRQAAEILLRNQWRGLVNAIETGMIVKVNSVLIPGVNTHETRLIAERAGELGADIMNILPLIPQAEFESLKRPSHKTLMHMREQCRPFIQQMTHCRQCRADACGALGEDKDMESEVLMARIGEEYCESVM